ncbi:MAG: PcfJ domain-containing protein, partial [Bacteroidota bacterium]
ALAQWFDLVQKGSDQLSDEHLALACTILLESLFHDSGDQGTTEEFLDFLMQGVPVLQNIFPECRDTDRFADWFTLWRDHARKAVPNLPQEHPYYELAFPTILKYIPPAIWWNNGLPYRNGEKAFHYYSDEFFWLATGGSLRKMPNHPPYSKRMAKEFNALPPELRHGDNDTYTYCFLLSLGCLHEMALAVQRYFQRPEELADLPAWKEQLDPIVQTLRNYNIDWQDNVANFLLGYVYHLFRDQPEFSISGRAEEHLLRDAEAYYDRIEARRAEQARRNAEREAARRREENRDYWEPLRGVKAWEETFGRYDRVRKRQIVELTTQGAITAESASMKHCVSTYFRACKNGASSIWSLRELRQNGSWYSVLTLEIRPNLRSIVQIRGRFNARAGKEQMAVIRQWAEREGLHVLDT